MMEVRPACRWCKYFQEEKVDEQDMILKTIMERSATPISQGKCIHPNKYTSFSVDMSTRCQLRINGKLAFEPNLHDQQEP